MPMAILLSLDRPPEELSDAPLLPTFVQFTSPLLFPLLPLPLPLQFPELLPLLFPLALVVLVSAEVGLGPVVTVTVETGGHQRVHFSVIISPYTDLDVFVLLLPAPRPHDLHLQQPSQQDFCSRCVAHDDALIGLSCLAAIGEEGTLYGRHRVTFQIERSLGPGQEPVERAY
jgi:hypothetical protein